MKPKVDRGLIINLILLAAVVLTGVWIMNNTYWGETTVKKPLSGDAATDPFYAAQKLTDALGAHGEWKHILGDLPPTDTVMVLSNWNWDVIEQRREKLQRWVEAGGRLVVDSSLIMTGKSFENWSGLSYDAVKHKSDDTDEDEKEEEPVVNRGAQQDLCYLVDVAGSFEVMNSESISRRVSLCNYNRARFISSQKKVEWGLKDDHGWQVAHVNIGKGSVTLFNAYPYQYRGMLLGDHALMLVVTTQLKRGDQVFFIMDEKGVPLLKLIWHYASPVVILALLLVAAMIWRNGTRFGPMMAMPDAARRSLREQVAGTGRFILQFNGEKVLHAAAVRALMDAARRHIAHYERLDTAARLEALAQVTGLNTEELTTAVHHNGARRASELRQAIALMEQARRHLVNNKLLSNKISNHHEEKSSGRSHAS
ncbi:MAG: DUF4350 domain-containing protein [Polaromonas sp.]|nr:DUF4350 domain-containing protein [Polaromonas sp.]